MELTHFRHLILQLAVHQKMCHLGYVYCITIFRDLTESAQLRLARRIEHAKKTRRAVKFICRKIKRFRQTYESDYHVTDEEKERKSQNNFLIKIS